VRRMGASEDTSLGTGSASLFAQDKSVSVLMTQGLPFDDSGRLLGGQFRDASEERSWDLSHEVLAFLRELV